MPLVGYTRVNAIGAGSVVVKIKLAVLVPVEPAVKTKLVGAVSVVAVVEEEYPSEEPELEELPPNNAIGKRAVRGD